MTIYTSDLRTFRVLTGLWDYNPDIPQASDHNLSFVRPLGEGNHKEKRTILDLFAQRYWEQQL
jgi:hypothetical protein